MNNKKIVYVSNMCTEQKLDELFQGDYQGVSQQIQRYHRILVSGLSMCESFDMYVLSALPITKKNCSFKKIKKEICEEQRIKYHYLATRNSSILKRMGDFFGGFFNTMKYSKKNTILIVDILDVCVVLGALFAAKIKGIKAIGIVTDLPDYLFVIGKTHAKLANANIRVCNAYILLTEQMNQVINAKKKKPYIVLEGHVPTFQMGDEESEKKYEQKVCLYAGILDERYGVKELVEGFISANLKNVKLHLYGDGPYKKELMEFSEKNPSVCYKGIKSNKEIVAEEKKVALLINPRPSIDEFVKYSFPSKNLEYMVSGTPVLTTLLPGMPKEYKAYVYQIKVETANGISSVLKEVFAKSQKERELFGEQAKQFVLLNKSEIAQAKKIESFLRENYDN